MMAVSRLLKSWAMPPAIWPMASMTRACSIFSWLTPMQLLGALALADITGEDQVVLLPVVADVVGVHLDGDVRAVLGAMHALVGERTALPDHFPTGTPVLRQSAVDVEDGHAEQFFSGVAEVPAGGVTDEDETAVRGGPEDLVGGVIDRELRTAK